jgi:hypothetical protein
MMRFYMLLCGVFLYCATSAQYTTNSAAISTSGSTGATCFQLTPATNYSKGSVFYNTPINLTQNFEAYTELYFGVNELGGDGMAFIFQNEGTGYIGNYGAGIGYHRFNGENPSMPSDVPGPVPSFIMEFDTYQNFDILGQQIGDPIGDHIGFMSNSNAYHTSPSALAPPQELATNLESGMWYPVKFSWNATTKTFTAEVTISSTPLVKQTYTYTGDIVNTIFGGNPVVYWGFTGSNGSFFPNEHKVCILPPPPPPVPPTCGQLRTQTPGGWGAPPNGNNPGTYLHAKFAQAFPLGLTVGRTGGYTVKFTSAQAITDYLPAGGQAKPLTANYVNPSTNSLKNVLVNHLVALTLSVGFDKYDANFASSNVTLGDYIIGEGPFKGWTVNAFLAEANKIVSGGTSSFSVQDVVNTASAINENNVDGTMNNGYLVCPTSGSKTAPSLNRPEVTLNEEGSKVGNGVYPNPSRGQFEVRLPAGLKGSTQVLITNMTGKVVERRTVQTTGSAQVVSFDLSGQASGMYLVRVVTSNGVTNHKLVIQK